MLNYKLEKQNFGKITLRIEFSFESNYLCNNSLETLNWERKCC